MVDDTRPAVFAKQGFFLDDFPTIGAISFIEAKRRCVRLAVAFENRLDAVRVGSRRQSMEFENDIVARVADLPVDDEAVTFEWLILA